MKLNLILTLSLSLAASYTTFAQEKYGNLIGCENIDLSKKSKHHGKTFLHLIRETVKPELDIYATQGYKVTSGQNLVDGLDKVESKVKRQALKSVRGSSKAQKIKNLKAIGDKLEGETVNLYNLPGKLAATKLVGDRYTLSTYIGLISCGGSTMKLAPDNYAYNIHYGTGDVDKDDRTGRSFGASRIYHATDSSYSHYLKTLKNYVTKTPDNVQYFTKTIMETLTSSNPRGYKKVNDHGDAVLTDFFAIWTAEQTRNIMDGYVKLHWDAALFQTTLLSAFHAGQDKIKMFYKDPLSGKVYFTDKTYKLKWPRKNHEEETCEVDLESRKVKSADLTDYIGVHYRTYKHCGRSGVNMSRNEWKKLGREITKYLYSSEEGSKLLADVREILGEEIDLSKNERGKKYRKSSHDIYRELARYLIKNDAPASFKKWEELSKKTNDLLEYVRANANTITEIISAKFPKQIEE
ncbi:hypothetical protein N9N67_07005 [Bacteriovoracaceae bacterium]|nr:hypothetical protein [Bacteriovoracaceae bacterium]